MSTSGGLRQRRKPAAIAALAKAKGAAGEEGPEKVSIEVDGRPWLQRHQWGLVPLLITAAARAWCGAAL
jgi:hypothetical protein